MAHLDPLGLAPKPCPCGDDKLRAYVRTIDAGRFEMTWRCRACGNEAPPEVRDRPARPARGDDAWRAERGLPVGPLARLDAEVAATCAFGRMRAA